MKPSESVLKEAERIINGRARDDYGDSLESFERIAKLWSPVLGIEVTPEDVALCLIQLKVARAVNGQANDGIQRDSIVDIAGYAGCLENIMNAKGKS